MAHRAAAWAVSRVPAAGCAICCEAGMLGADAAVERLEGRGTAPSLGEALGGRQQGARG